MNAVSISADRVVLLGRVAPVAADGLFIEGIATTKHRHSKEVPLPAGVIRPDGGTTTWTSGLFPKKVRVDLPIPLHWNHELDTKIGEVFALGATDLALHFRACIFPIGTAGCDSELLSRVWRNVRSGKALAASVGVKHPPTSDGSWHLDELSVCVTGSNRFARITNIRAPNGEGLLERAPQPITLETLRDAWLEDREASRADPHWLAIDAFTRFRQGMRQLGVEENAVQHVRDSFTQFRQAMRQLGITKGTPSIYLGVWKPGEYSEGNTVTHNGVLWHCETNVTTDKPGTSSSWRMMHKSVERERARR